MRRYFSQPVMLAGLLMALYHICWRYNLALHVFRLFSVNTHCQTRKDHCLCVCFHFLHSSSLANHGRCCLLALSLKHHRLWASYRLSMYTEHKIVNPARWHVVCSSVLYQWNWIFLFFFFSQVFAIPQCVLVSHTRESLHSETHFADLHKACKCHLFCGVL